MGPRHDIGEEGVRHYWGDTVRQLLLIAAIAILFDTSNLLEVFPEAVLGKLLAVLSIVAFAAMTTPLRRWVLVGDAVISALGFLFYATWAVLTKSFVGSLVHFATMALAAVFLASFYFSVKTIRSMLLRQVEDEEEIEEPTPEPLEEEDSPNDDDVDNRLDWTDDTPERSDDELTPEEAEDESLIIHGGHMPVGDITDEAPRESFGK